MDLRTERTRKCIINAFVELRAKKPIEKITVKELTDMALVHKATFYNHYKDVYDLSEKLEDEVIESVFNDIGYFSRVVTEPRIATMELAVAMQSQGKLISILFSDSRQGILIQKTSKFIKERIYKIYPQYMNNLEFEIALSLLIQGSFYTVADYTESEHDAVISVLGEISENLMKKFSS